MRLVVSRGGRMAAELRVQLLGPLQVSVAGCPVGPSGSLRRSLFALLALEAGHVVSSTALVDALWGESPPRSAGGVLQTYVSTWRRSLREAGDLVPTRIATIGHGYELSLSEAESDLLGFRRWAEEGRRLAASADGAGARRALERALALWRGPALADLSELPFHPSVTRPLEEHRHRAVEDWAEMVLQDGTADDVAGVVAELERVRSAAPWRERATALLMWALLRCARQRDALEAYEETRHRLSEELGVDPGPDLRAMHARVLRQDPALLRARTTLGARPRRRLDSFVGRQRELEDVSRLLETVRLVVLTGPGGSGKTRLAEEVAGEYALRNGVDTYVVELASIEDVALVPGAIATQLGIPAESLEALAARIATRDLLLVLDNLEQISGVGELVTMLLSEAPGLHVLATSREPLRVTGEQRYGVEPLAVPGADERSVGRLRETPSVVMLLDRARAVDPRMRVDEATAAAVRDVVRAVDGLPLALEIVAPWLSTLTPDGLLAELSQPLELRSRQAVAQPRHRTLRATIAWSHDRLGVQEQRLLAWLSVLRGGGELDAVRAVAGSDLDEPVLDVLVDLVDRALVHRTEPVQGRPRFVLLETVRQFAAEQLDSSGDRAAAELRAAEWFAGWAVELARHSDSRDADAWVARAVADAENLRTAMDVFEREGRADEHLQLVVDCYALWWNSGYEQEGVRRLEHALTMAKDDSPARAIGLCYLGWLLDWDTVRARQLIEEAITLAKGSGDKHVLAFGLMALSTTTDVETSISLATEAVALAERLLGTPSRYASTSSDTVLSFAAAELGADWSFRWNPTAIEWQERILDVARRGGGYQVAHALADLAMVNSVGGHYATAAELVERALQMFEGPWRSSMDDLLPAAQGRVLHCTGDRAGAEAVMRASIAAARAGGRQGTVHHQSCALVDVLVDRGNLHDADAVLRDAEALHSDAHDPEYLSRLRVRRARLLRLSGHRDEARAVLRTAEDLVEPTALRPERVIFLVESALLADSDVERRRWLDILKDLARKTGVQVFPWEMRLLAAAGF
jgi:predicted ATPase/DNA-binding SARP family transcriptional activator